MNIQSALLILMCRCFSTGIRSFSAVHVHVFPVIHWLIYCIQGAFMLMLPLNFFTWLDFNSICNTSIQTNLWTVQPHLGVTVPGTYPELTCNMMGWLNGNGTICHVETPLQSPVRCHVHTCQWQPWLSALLTMIPTPVTSQMSCTYMSMATMAISTPHNDTHSSHQSDVMYMHVSGNHSCQHSSQWYSL